MKKWKDEGDETSYISVNISVKDLYYTDVYAVFTHLIQKYGISAKNLKLEINIFIEGLMCEYVKYCRGYSTANVDDLYEYTKEWLTTFAKNRL